jgi:capsid protein
MKLPFFAAKSTTSVKSPPLLSSRRSKASVPRIVNNVVGFSSGGAKSVNGISGDGGSYSINSTVMMKNARRAYHDSVEAHSIVDRNADIVVDVGIKISPSINASILGLTEEQADKFNDKIQERFDLFCSSKTSNRSRRLNVYQAQRLFQKTALIDNDQFVRFYFEKEDDSLSSVSFEFIEPLDIIGEGVTCTDSYVNYNDGIIRDAKGREIAYKVRVRNVDGSYKYVEIPAKRAGRTIMHHGFERDQISQLRGYSQYGHILQEFQNITDFKLAHIDKAIQQASLAIAVTNDGDNDPSNPFEDLTTPAGVRPSDFVGYESLTEDQKQEAMNIDHVDEFVTGNRGSLAVVNLKSKDKITAIGNTAPVTNYDKFVDSFISTIAASARMPVEVLLMKFGQNYSASRAALLLFYRVAEIYRMNIDIDFMTPLYDNWLAEEIADGRVSCPGWSDPILRAAWLKHTIIAAPVPNIDPYKSMMANKGNIEISATTVDRAAQETNGSNGKSNRAANARQLPELIVPYWAEDKRIQDELLED